MRTAAAKKQRNKTNIPETGQENDTIAGISTAVGGGIGVIRISGNGALDVVSRIFAPGGNPSKRVKYENRRVYYGKIIFNGATVDEVLLTVMLAPKTYTREDVAEISCHGGHAGIMGVLSAVLAGGARLAEPGEFTKRAFLNGRIDLTQAEAVMDVISSKSAFAHKTAQMQLEGGLGCEIARNAKLLLGEIARIEAAIDYPEHEFDLDEAFSQSIVSTVLTVTDDLKRLLETYGTGKFIADGIKTVISGKPNVGKSSLLNAMLGHERAIVTELPGTTRDVLTEYINIGSNGNIVLKLHDTAGLREAGDAAEKIGVKRSRAALAGADLVLLVLDGSEALIKEDFAIIDDIGNVSVPVICVVNKIDLPQALDAALLRAKGIAPENTVFVSAKAKNGINTLEEKIEEIFFNGSIHTDAADSGVIVTNARHANVLRRCVTFLENALETIRNGLPEDFVSIDITAAYSCLCEITGENADDSIIDKIFSEFCLGK